MRQKLRLTLQIIMLFVFAMLMFLGKAQIWMGLILLSLILTTFWGRFYCGWICPMNTLIRPTRWLSRKLNIEKKGIPSLFKTRKPKYFMFLLFLGGLGYTIYTISQGDKFPLPLIIIPIALISTFFINEATWHTYLCPWGTLFSFTGRFSKGKITSGKCSGCSVCAKACPADAIIVDGKNGTVSNSTNCLLCFECVDQCPIHTLKYKK